MSPLLVLHPGKGRSDCQDAGRESKETMSLQEPDEISRSIVHVVPHCLFRRVVGAAGCPLSLHVECHSLNWTK